MTYLSQLKSFLDFSGTVSSTATAADSDSTSGAAQ
jgi:hypothetical protein